jgi:hypothetical protein
MNAARVAMIIISDNNFRQAGGNALAQTNVFRCTALQETGADFHWTKAARCGAMSGLKTRANYITC